MLPIHVPDRLKHVLPKHSGRDAHGHVSVRHQGGRHKRYYRVVDFKREKMGIPARVVTIEYDPNRSANVALVHYEDGEKRYILAPRDLIRGATIVSGTAAEIKPGNALPLYAIPIGTPVHNIELVPGRGAKIVRSAGTTALVLAREEGFVQVKLPSGEIRKIPAASLATVGHIGRDEWRNLQVGKAGRNRHRGHRPQVRGVAQNPRTHPHGGGEGRSGIGLASPKSPWGKATLGKKTRLKGKYSDRYIIARRKK